MENKVHCPKCGSDQISGNKKGVSVGKAVVGAALVGPAGLLAGAAGRNSVIVTCLNCGHSWKAGAQIDKPKPKAPSLKWAAIILIVCVILAALLFSL